MRVIASTAQIINEEVFEYGQSVLNKNKIFFPKCLHIILNASSGNTEKQRNEIQRQREISKDKEGYGRGGEVRQ